MEEGYIKYNCVWEKCEIEVPEILLNELNEIRSKLVKMGMIGKLPNGPGFGNISIRKNRNVFYITGTNTGHVAIIEPENLSLVSQVDIKSNKVWCSGFSQASSESLSHAAIYETLSWVNTVIHVHHKLLWKYYSNKLPTTNEKVSYGTIEMADQIKGKLMSNAHSKLLVLGGHEDGLIAFGKNLSEAFIELDNLFRSIK